MVAAVFEVVAEPSRRRILDLLREDEQPVGALVEALGLSQPAVSKHLRVLRDAGLVEARVDAQRRLYRLRPEPLREIDEWLAPYRAAWAARLDALERHLDAIPETEERSWTTPSSARSTRTATGGASPSPATSPTRPRRSGGR